MAKPEAQFLNEEAVPSASSLMEIVSLRIRLKQRELLCNAMKLRFILEKLMRLGKPRNVNKRRWNRIHRLRQWDNFLTRQDNHPLVQRFINCLGFDQADRIKIIFDIIDGQIRSFFQGGFISDTVFRSGSIPEVVKCLLSLEEEVLAA